MLRRSCFVLAFTFAAALLPATSHALPVPPVSMAWVRIVVSSSDPVMATFQGGPAGRSDDLYLILEGSKNPGRGGDPTDDWLIFDSRNASAGDQLNLGSFDVGTVLTLRLYDYGTDHGSGHGPGDHPADRNGKGQARGHAMSDWRPGETLVGFEDLLDWSGSRGDLRYIDLAFSFTNTKTDIAEPLSLGIFLLGLAGIAVTRPRIVRR